MPWPLDTSRSATRFARLQVALGARYRLERELGPAGAVTTFVARDLTTDRPVALKLFDSYRTAAAGYSRMLRDLRTAAAVEHAHVLPLLDAGVVPTEDGNAVYYTVPFLAGESLRARLDREVQLPIADALAIAEDVAAALAAAHALGVPHGAVAPESVVLAGGQALLADFGVSASLDGRPPDPRSDIRGLGRLLYEMLSGAPPAAGAPALRAVRGGIPEEVELTVGRLLAGARGGYATAEEAHAAIRTAAAGVRPVAAPGLTTGERAVQRRRVPARWTVFTFALLGLFGLSLWLRYNAAEPAFVQSAPARPESIAVLPFMNATPDTANLLFSDGLTRELTARLGEVPGMRVAGSGSAFRVGGPGVDPRHAGERLGVDVVLRGSVRHYEGRLRVRASLTSVREGFDLWSETYEREAADFTAIGSEIAASVAAALRLPPPSPPASAPAVDAHAVYLRGQQALRAGDTAAVSLYQAAVQLDSSFAPAWAGLAEAWLQARASDSLTPAALADSARAAAERALVLDSTLGEASAALGTVRFLYERRWAEAETLLRASLERNGNVPETRLRLAHLLLVVGRVDESSEVGREAAELSPFDPAVRLALARQALHVGDYVRAEADVERAAALGGASAETDLLRGFIAASIGRYADAVAPLERAGTDTTLADEAQAMLGWVHALSGRREEAREVRAELQEATATRYVPGYYLAFLADALGDRRGAFLALERAVTDRAPELVNLRIDPRMDRLRVDRRLDELARRIGLP